MLRNSASKPRCSFSYLCANSASFWSLAEAQARCPRATKRESIGFLSPKHEQPQIIQALKACLTANKRHIAKLFPQTRRGQKPEHQILARLAARSGFLICSDSFSASELEHSKRPCIRMYPASSTCCQCCSQSTFSCSFMTL